MNDDPIIQEKNGKPNETGEIWQNEMKDVEFAKNKAADNGSEKEKANQVGEVYGEIAKNAMISNGLSEDEANKKVANSTFEELESIVNVSGLVEAACRGIAHEIKVDVNSLTAAVLHGEDKD